MTAILRYAVVALATIGLIYLWAWFNKAPIIPPGAMVEATPAAEVRKEDKAEVTVAKPVKVYKPAIKGKLRLPASVTEDTNQHVIASSKTADDERQHTLTTVIDQRTGETTTFDRAEPLPWFAVNTRTDVGVFVGMKGGEQTVRVSARQEFLQIKALHFGAVASTDMTRHNTPDTFIGVGAWARW